MNRRRKNNPCRPNEKCPIGFSNRAFVCGIAFGKKCFNALLSTNLKISKMII
jgi:hypothetical protein